MKSWPRRCADQAGGGDTRHSGQTSGGRALVTGIRHWSTATYTRVAIDLGEGVDLRGGARTQSDRIYFDLHGTRLAPELVARASTSR